jgi:trimeric autotransporter adhesin
MSTKTTFKRIALVAVASMGFGLLSAAPSSAAITAGTTFVHAGTGATTAANFASSVSVPVGTPATINLTMGATGDANTDTVRMTSALTTAPATTNGVATNAITTATFTTVGTPVNSAITAGASTNIVIATAAAAGAFSTVQTLSYTPTVPGIYVITTTALSTGGGTVLTNGSLTHVLTINAGFSADPIRANRAFPIQGSNITSGWAATAGGQATVRITGMAATTQYFVTTDTGAIISGIGSDPGTRTGTVTNTNGTNLSGGFNFTTGAATASDHMDVRVTDLGAATTTVTVRSFNASTGAASTFAAATVTWGVAAVASAQYSLLTLNAGAGTTATGAAADTTATVVANTSGTKQFTIQVAVKNQYDVDFTAATLSASITGPGSLGIAQGTASSAALSGRSVSSAIASNLGHVTVFGDGTSGKATITISAGTVVLGTKEVTFVGAPATATVSQVLFVAKAGTRLGRIPTTSRVVTTAGGITTHAAMRATVLDAGGNPVVAGSTVRIVSSDETVIVPGTCAEYTVTGSTTANVAAPGVFECSVSGANGAVSGKTATITFEVRNATTGLWSLSATPITFAIGGDIASVALATDKATYAPGEAMTMTATAKDSAGNAPFDGQNPYVSISANMTVVGAPATTAIIVNGVHTTNTSTGTKTMFAPSSVGNLVVSGLTTNATTGTAYSVALKIANEELDSALAAAADAAAEATDAANAATDAANAAAEAADAATAAAQDAADAVAALSTSVTAMVDTLRKQITSLTNLVIKIQRKVRA